MDISIIIPAYNEVESLPHLIKWISQYLAGYNYTYEILVVDDGSDDGTWEKLDELQKQYKPLKALKFLNNYGKTAAICAGFKVVEGEVVITMDADLQDNPEEIAGLYKMVKEDKYHLVSGWKKKRFDPLSKIIPTKLFNWATRQISGIKLHDFNCGLKAYAREVVKNIHIYGEMHRYIPMVAKWKGFERIGEKIVKHQARRYGKTKFGLERFMHGFLDLLSIFFVLKFRKRPMHFFGSFGILFFLSGGGITAWLILQKLLALNSREVVEQPLFFLAILLIILGAQLFLAGFLSELIISTNTEQEDFIIEKRLGYHE